MAKPINRKKQKNWYIMISLGSYLLILYVCCHLGQFTSEPDFIRVFQAAVQHIQTHPFEIYPFNKDFMLKAAFMALVVPLLFYAEYLRRRDLRPREESGSSHWNEDMRSYYKKYTEMALSWPKKFYKFPLKLVRLPFMLLDKILSFIPLVNLIYKGIKKMVAKRFGTVDRSPGSKNMILTEECYLSMNGRKTRRNSNVLCIGGSGAGKSRFLVKPNLLQANSSYVITDPSGELLETMGKPLEKLGYEVRVFNLVQMDHSSTYNPFHYIRDQNGVLTLITALIQNTTPKGSSTSDPFWEKAETALLKACCFYLWSECPKEDQNFSNVMKLLRCANAAEGQENVDSALDILFKDLEAKDPEHIAVQSYKVFKSAGGGKTAQSILISCLARLQHFDLTAVKNLTSTDSLNLGDIGDKPVALFCIMPTADTSFNFILALMFTQMFETLYHHAETDCKGKRLKSHVRFILDEFANIGTIPEFDQKLSTCRKYEISCTIILQALAQLKSKYKDDWSVLIGNCDTFLFLGSNDHETLEYVSKLLGKETIRSVNNSRTYGKQGSSNMSYNKTGRELMTPDELRVMDNDNCVLLIRGLYPFFARKYIYEEHPHYHLTGDADDANLFDVRAALHTGRPAEMPREHPRATRLMTEAERADTREAERQYLMNNRPVRNRSAKGRDLGTVKPLEEEFQSLKSIKDPEHMTREEMERLAAETAGLRVRTVVNQPHEIDQENYKQEQVALFDAFDSFYGIPNDQEAYDEHEAEDAEREEK